MTTHHCSLKVADSLKESYRDYTNVNPLVIQTYKLNHQLQTLNYVQEMKTKYCLNHNRFNMSMWDMLEKCNEIIDESDPDIHLPQIYHAIQTAENIRTKYPKDRELQLVGLIHDVGKVLLLEDFGQLPQWSVVGDTFPLGCQYSNKIVYSEFFPDNNYDKFGIYTPNCGLDNLQMSFGHDEYLFSVLDNCCNINKENLRIIRYHSFYAFHQQNEYHYLANKKDLELKSLLQMFSKCDLYSKEDTKNELEEYKSYYSELVEEFCPGKLDW